MVQSPERASAEGRCLWAIISIAPCSRAERTPYSSSVNRQTTYLSVQVPLICLFLSLDLDYLLAARTATSKSWQNPVEWIKSTLNLGLQSVEPKLEVNHLKKMQYIAIVSQSSAKLLIRSPISPQKLLILWPQKSPAQSGSLEIEVEGKKHSSGCSCLAVNHWWLAAITFCCFQKWWYPKLWPSDKKVLFATSSRSTCSSVHVCHTAVGCVTKKCGDMSCNICKPVRLPHEVFKQLKPFSDPEPGVDQHYKAFNMALKQMSDIKSP